MRSESLVGMNRNCRVDDLEPREYLNHIMTLTVVISSCSSDLPNKYDSLLEISWDGTSSSLREEASGITTRKRGLKLSLFLPSNTCDTVP